MQPNQRLDQQLDMVKSPMVFGENYFKDLVPDTLYENMRAGWGRRPYQQEAFGRFLHYCQKKQPNTPTHLLYHMATGSGKTLIMVGLILHLYEQGYRNFLFFVNSTNIIKKTKQNFLNPQAGKYLFAQRVVINHKEVRIKEVDNFQGANEDDINIVFQTIQGLHYDLNNPKENSLTYDDFVSEKIVLISDEAHHINATTKKQAKLSKDELMDAISWENTVKKIFESNNENVMLEFTATVDFNEESIKEKYNDKLIYDYPLKQFRKDGYSKDVKTLQAELNEFERALQGIILNQYRRKIFEKNKIFIKPVILFKSKTIKGSTEFYEEFLQRMKTLTPEDLEKIKLANRDNVVTKAFDFFEQQEVTLGNLIMELREDFSEEKCIVVNSKQESEELQIAVNTLEEDDNEYRAVFAVDKLNEGWDVLNLFDIVRLYNTRDAKGNKVGKTTMSEAQLIGRGARYCPFQLDDEQPLYQRKYDEMNEGDEVAAELKVCEELYYHSAYNPRYIQELNTALEQIGIKAKETKQIRLELKPSFEDTDFYKTAYVFKNKRQIKSRNGIYGLKTSITEHLHKVDLLTGFTSSSTLLEGEVKDKGIEKKRKDFQIGDFGDTIIRKALHQFELYKFSNLGYYLPNLTSISEFITSDNYLGNVKVEVKGTEQQIENLTNKDKLRIAINVLDEIQPKITAEDIKYEGTRKFEPFLLKDVIKNKVMNFAIDDGGAAEVGKSMKRIGNPYYLDLSQREWYAFEDCYGTSEEKLMIQYIDKVYDELKAKYEEIYLVRNERHFKVYSFENGQATEPDFVLYLKKTEASQSFQYQIFIEPKGGHLLEKDKWKEDFLKSIKAEHTMEKVYADKGFVLWGLPFYNEQFKKKEFEEAVRESFL